VSGQHTGVSDIPLTDNGRRLAERLRPVLAKETFVLILVSPQQRARETCTLAGIGDRAVVDPDIMEWDYGEYEGQTPEQILDATPDWMIFRDGCPGGETPERSLHESIVRSLGCVPLWEMLHCLRTGTCYARWQRDGSVCLFKAVNTSY
jgi:broad specificity phosphatase PhoE